MGSLMECALRDGVSYRQGDDEEHPDHGFKCEEPPVCRDVASATDDIQTSVQVAELEIIKQDSFPDIVLGHSKSNMSPVVGRVKKSQMSVSFENYWSILTDEDRGEKKKRRRKKKEGHAEHVQREPENSRPSRMTPRRPITLRLPSTRPKRSWGRRRRRLRRDAAGANITARRRRRRCVAMPRSMSPESVSRCSCSHRAC